MKTKIYIYHRVGNVWRLWRKQTRLAKWVPYFAPYGYVISMVSVSAILPITRIYTRRKEGRL